MEIRVRQILPILCRVILVQVHECYLNRECFFSGVIPFALNKDKLICCISFA